MSGPAKMVVNLTRGGNLPARRRNGFRTAVLDKARAAKKQNGKPELAIPHWRAAIIRN
jgi:hypothetical protein